MPDPSNSPADSVPPPRGAASADGAGSRHGPHPGPRAATWLIAALLALVHISILTLVAAAGPDPVVTFAVMAAPALASLAVRPVATLRRGYRWLAVWAAALLSVTPLPVLFVGEAWVFGRIWLERADRPGTEPRCTGRRVPAIRLGCGCRRSGSGSQP